MASVRGTDPCLAAGSDPDCVTTKGPRHNIRWDRSVLAAWPLVKKRKSGHTGTEKEIGQTKRNTPKPKKRSPDCFLLLLLAFAFALHLPFHDLKALKLKEKSKIKKTRVRTRPSGRIRTRDPDPAHFGSYFDSGSGHGSAFTDPQSGCLP